MPDKLIIEFVIDWIQKKNVRCDVLHKENTGMTGQKLTSDQRDALVSFSKKKIFEEIDKEMKGLGIDLNALRKAIWNLDPDEPWTGGLSTAVYDEGKTHIRKVEPATVGLNAQTPITLLGQGFDPTATITVECRKGNATTKTFVASSLTCDVDVWQRVAVSVKLDATGEWAVFARNSTDPAGVWSEPPGTVHVF